MTNAPPDGFAPHFRKSNVTDPWEPLFSRRGPRDVMIGLWLREAHCNSRGLVHGGVIATLADNAMGLSYIQALSDQLQSDGPAPSSSPPASARGAVTVNLSIDYLASARMGEWLQVEPRVVRAGRTLGFVDALVTADGKAVARANATFNLIG